MKKKVIYTVLVGGYDNLMQPKVIDDSFDYICFTDKSSQAKLGVWEVKPIDYSDAGGDNTRTSRFPKLQPHKVLAEYDYSLYMDANIQIVSGEFYEVVNKRIAEGVLIAQVPNPFRKCIYQDIRIAYRLGKVTLSEARRQYRHLREEGFPHNYGLYENNVILRRHNAPQVVSVSDGWWAEYNTYSHRDQFSLMYVYWKQGFMPEYLFDDVHNARNTSCLRLVPHPHRGGVTDNEQMWQLYKKVCSGLRKIMVKLYLS